MPQPDISHAVWDTANGIGVYCEDTTLYSMDFVRCLRRMGLPALLHIKGGFIHGEGPEPTAISPELADTIAYYFTGDDQHGEAELTVRRLNYTTISARFHMKDMTRKPVIFNGRCDLGCGFILGAESDDGDEGAYFVDVYWSRDGCFSFRIGMDGARLCAKVTGTCLEKTNGYVGPQLFRVE